MAFVALNNTNSLVYLKGHFPGRQTLGPNLDPWPSARQRTSQVLPTTSKIERFGLGDGHDPFHLMLSY